MRRYHYKALTMRILTVAVINLTIGSFAVYIDCIRGKSHDSEFMEVAETGTRLDKEIAKILYPTLFEKYFWRD